MSWKNGTVEEKRMLLGDNHHSRQRWGTNLGTSIRRTITKLSTAAKRVSKVEEFEDVELYIASTWRRAVFVVFCTVFVGLPYLLLRHNERALVKATHRRARYGDDEELVVLVKPFRGSWVVANDSEFVDPGEIRALLRRVIETDKDVLSENYNMLVQASRDGTAMYGLVFEVQYRRYVLVEVVLSAEATLYSPGSLLFDSHQLESELDHMWILSTVEGSFHPSVEELFVWDGEGPGATAGALVLRENMPGIDQVTAEDRLVLYGENVLTVRVPSRSKLFVNELLHPFFLFQIWAVVLWLFENYYYYALCILFTSLYSAFVEASDVHENWLRLSRLALEKERVTVIRNSREAQISSCQLVPGDIMLVTPGMRMPCDGTILRGSALTNEASLTGESSPVRKTPWMPSAIDLLNDEDASEMSELEDEEEEKDEVLVAFEQEHDYVEEKTTDRAVPIEAPTSSILSGGPASTAEVGDSWARSEHVIYNGTNVLDSRSPTMVIVTRTRAETVRGDLVRDILVDSRSSAGAVATLHRDSYVVLLALASIGLMTTIWAVNRFINLFGVSTFNAVLQGLDLITIALPPALPATVTFGLVYAIKRLQKKRILVTRANAVTTSAWLDVLCFDKTGTLTEEGLDVKGVLPCVNGAFESKGFVRNDGKYSEDLVRLMASCHALSRIDGEIVGDEVDLKMFELSEWKLENSEQSDKAVLQVSDEDGNLVNVLRAFDFKSDLARMSVIAQWETGCSIFTKGAPEMVASKCQKSTVPRDLHSVLDQYAEQGYRVLALAQRSLMDADLSEAMIQPRSRIEKNLSFVGIVILENRLKPDTSSVLRELNLDAKVRTVMVTGDHPRTALSVARQCGIFQTAKDTPAIICEVQRGKNHGNVDGGISFLEVGTVEKKRLRRADVTRRLLYDRQGKQCNIVLTGAAFRALFAEHSEQKRLSPDSSTAIFISQLLKRCTVFARMSAADKTLLVRLINNEVGSLVGMCGDGANDAGALREAAVGISLCGDEDGEVTASLAAPLTSRITTISAVASSMKEGRAAASCSVAALKYMFMYSVLQLVSVSFLYNFGCNLSDGQFLFVDLFLIIPLGVLMGETEASDYLCEQNPPRRLTDKRVVYSAIGQGILMLGFQLLLMTYLRSLSYWPPLESIQSQIGKTGDLLDKNELVTAVFLYVNFQYVWSCWVFNLGPPFRKIYKSNKGYAITLYLATFFCAALTLCPPQIVSNLLRMKDLPMTCRIALTALAFVNLGACQILERYMNALDTGSRARGTQ